MDLLHLQYALEIAKYGSINQAAIALFMSQSNLSLAIKKLEQEVGIIIFNRTKKGVELTADGENFLVYAKMIQQNMESLRNISRLKNSNNENCVELNVSNMKLSYFSEAIVCFYNDINADKNNKITLQIKENDIFQTINDVYKLESDIGFIALMNDQKDFFLKFIEMKNMTFTCLLEEPMMVVLSKKHPMANRKQIDGHELNEYTVVVHNDLEHMPYGYCYCNKILGVTPLKSVIYINARATQVDILSRCHETFGLAMRVHPTILEAHDLLAIPLASSGDNYISMGYVLHNTKAKSKEVDRLISSAKDVFATK